MSRAVRPVTSTEKASSACASFRPPRLTYGWSGSTSVMSASCGTCTPAFGGLPVDAHVAGEDQRARAFARGRQPAFDEHHVEARSVLQFVRPTTHRAMAGSAPPSCASSRAASASRTHSAAIRRDSSRP